MKKKFLWAILSLLFIAGGCQDNNSTDETEKGEELSFGSKVVYIDCEENGQPYRVHAFEGHVVVYFQKGVEEAEAKAAIESLHGKILDKMPEIGYYLVDAGAGNENNFIAKIKDKNAEYAVWDLVYEMRGIAEAVFLENNITPIDGNTTHGQRVKEVYKLCSGEKVIDPTEELGYTDEKGRAMVKGTKAINEIGKRSGNFLYNLSFGPALRDENDDDIKWSKADAKQKKSYITQQQTQIKDVITRLKDLGGTNLSNTVVTIAAGNQEMPDFDKSIIEPMLTQHEPPESFELSVEEQNILKNNILIVTAKADYSNQFSSKHYAMAEVDISGDPYKGTSYAAPKALCYIVKLMKDKDLTAVEALAAAKKSIASLNGTFNLENALDGTTAFIEPVISTSNLTATSVTLTVRISPPAIIAAQQGTPRSVEICLSKTDSNPKSSYDRKHADYNTYNYSFNISGLVPQTLYFASSFVKTSSDKSISGEVIEFITPPERKGGLPFNFRGMVFDCKFSGFKKEDACAFEDLKGTLKFMDTKNIDNYIASGSISFATNSKIGVLSGDYYLSSDAINIYFPSHKLLLTGAVMTRTDNPNIIVLYGMNTYGFGKHFAAGDIHNFVWDATGYYSSPE
jgi:hypothetical protein